METTIDTNKNNMDDTDTPDTSDEECEKQVEMVVFQSYKKGDCESVVCCQSCKKEFDYENSAGCACNHFTFCEDCMVEEQKSNNFYNFYILIQEPLLY